MTVVAGFSFPTDEPLMTTPILQPGDAPTAVSEAPFVLLPTAAQLFSTRARRFERLAEATPAPADWLRFLAVLSDTQQSALSLCNSAPLPTSEARQQAAEHGMPPLATGSWTRDAVWQKALDHILANSRNSAPDAAREVIDRLTESNPTDREQLARQTLNFEFDRTEDRATSLFIAAALQVYWTALAARLRAEELVRLEQKTLCPCCGGLPVSSVVRTSNNSSQVSNLRYLHCALCNTEWNLVRIACTSCEDEGKVTYQSLQGHHPALRAETCDSCKSYLKIIYQEKDPQADPVADDLATLALDVLLDEAGYQRSGPNLFLLAGA